MVERHGRFGTFLACNTYPHCAFVNQIPKKTDPIEMEANEFLKSHGAGELVMKERMI